MSAYTWRTYLSESICLYDAESDPVDLAKQLDTERQSRGAEWDDAITETTTIEQLRKHVI